MLLTWKDAIGQAGLAGFISLIIFYLTNAFYSDLFNQYGDAGSRYLYAVGGFMMSLVTGMFVGTWFASPNTRRNAAWATTKVFLYSFFGWWLVAVIYDAFVLSSEFVNYVWYDYLLSFQVVLTYFAHYAFGSVLMFWTGTQIVFSVFFAWELKHQHTEKPRSYSRDQIKKRGY